MLYTDIRHTFSFRRQHAPANLNSNGRPQPQPSPHDIRARPVCQFFLKTAKRRLLFLIPILHQTTTEAAEVILYQQLFLIPILHQTTTRRRRRGRRSRLFLIPILHQTTTRMTSVRCYGMLFLIPILHQTTTAKACDLSIICCFSFQFYIKPQPSRMAVIRILHVTHMTPMHKTSCRTPGKLVGCNFVFQRAIYQKNSSC